MAGLFLDSHDAFLRWHQIGQDGPVTVWIPGIGFAGVGTFLKTVTHPSLPPLRSIIIDPLGTGTSDTASDPALSIADHADTVAALLDHLGHKACTLVGYSMGGAIAAELSVRRPDLVARLVLAEGNLLTGGGAGSRYMAEVSTDTFRTERLPEMLKDLRSGAHAGDHVDEFILGCWTHCDPASLYAMACALVSLRPALMSDICGLSIPRHYIFGEKTLADPATCAQTNMPDPDVLRDAGIEVKSLPGTGHDLMLTDPDAFADCIKPMLSP